MATTAVTLNGVTYFVPQPGEKGPTYDQDLTNYLIALATAFPQGGASPSSTFQALVSATTNPASVGSIRLAKTDLEEWRNSGNTGNDILGIGAGLGASGTGLDELYFQSTNASGLQQITGQPALQARLTTGGQSIGTSYATVIFQTADFDTDIGYNSGTGIYTVPVGKGGWYFVSAGMNFTQGTAPANVDLAITYNSTGRQDTTMIGAPLSAVNLSVAGVWNIAAGQTIQVQMKTSANTITLNGIGFSFFSLKRLV